MTADFLYFIIMLKGGMDHDVPQIKFTLFTFKEWFITKRTGLKIVYGPSDDIQSRTGKIRTGFRWYAKVCGFLSDSIIRFDRC